MHAYLIVLFLGAGVIVMRFLILNLSRVLQRSIILMLKTAVRHHRSFGMLKGSVERKYEPLFRRLRLNMALFGLHFAAYTLVLVSTNENCQQLFSDQETWPASKT